MLDPKHELANTQSLSVQEVKEWVVQGPSLETINQVRLFGFYLGKTLKKAKVRNLKNGKDKFVDESVTTSQIRQIFTKMKSIEAKGGLSDVTQRTDFLMLKPLLAYAVGRHKKTGLDRLKERLDWGIDEVLSGSNEAEEQQRFNNFCKLFEAVLAYHRASGGK